MNGIVLIVVESSLRATGLALCVGAILGAARIRSGAVRHAAWMAVLCAMPLMPLLPRITPALRLAVPLPAIAYKSAPPMTELPDMQPASPGAMAVPTGVSAEPVPTPSQPPRGPVWPLAVIGLYVSGLVFLLARVAAGWRAARRIVRTAEPVTMPAAGVAVCQSPLVAVPLTTGILSPRVVLPRAWTLWPESKLRAVLSHEAAHVRRRDGIVNLAAQLNCCIFWFHPLAWWLERQLAITAEHACDEAAVRATGEGREYAVVLVDLAGEVRSSGGRFSLQGIGMHGAGSLEQRISRILRGDLARGASRSRKAAVAAGCAAAVFLVAACQQGPSQSALVAKAEARAQQYKEDSARWAAESKAQRDLQAAANALTPGQAAAMEAALTRNPNDLETRKKLLAYYMPAPGRLGVGGVLAAPAANVYPALRRHVLWMIEHHPEEQQASWFSVFGPDRAGQQPDPAGYAQARKLWHAQADRDGQPASVYQNAASFFRFSDQPVYGRMLQRAQAADPKGESLHGMYSGSWSAAMGSAYAQAFNSASMPLAWTEWMKPVTSDGEQSAYIAEIRRKLEQSNDATLLLFAAGTLVSMHRPGEPSRVPGIDPFAIGKAAVERALQLDPKSTWARQFRNKVRDQELLVSLPEAVWNGPLESRLQAIQALPDGDRFRELSILAISAGDEGVRADVMRHDAAAAKAAWQQAGKYAQEALDIAPKARNHPDYGTAWFNANMVLGMAAMSTGDVKSAAGYLAKAADAPATDELRYPMAGERPWPMNWFPDQLAKALLQAGQRDAVAGFLDRYARITVTNRERSLEDAALIRGGKTPAWY